MISILPLDGGDAWWQVSSGGLEPALASATVVDWATLVATIFAFIGASVFALEANTASRESADAAKTANDISGRLLELERRRDDEAKRDARRRQFEAERSQAEGVTAWIEQAQDGEWQAWVDNASHASIFEVEVILIGPRTISSIPKINVVRLDFGMVRPGEASRPFSTARPFGGNAEVMVPQRGPLGTVTPAILPETPEMYGAKVAFKDSGGRIWERGTDGQLSLVFRPSDGQESDADTAL